MKKLAELLLLGYAVIALMGADTQEVRFQKLGDKIMCTCSCAQMLLKCNHVGCPNSDRMIRELRANVQQNMSDEDVLNWFRKTWGVTAVVEPATHGLELWAWILPPAALVLGIGLAIVVVRRWHKPA